MVQPNQLKEVSLKAVRRTGTALEHTFREIPDAAVSTARIIISAEEKLRQRVRSALRVALATVFLGISGLISLGANVTMAFAKKVSPESTRVKKEKSQKTIRYHRHSVSTGDRHGKHGHHNANASTHGVASWYGNEFHNRRTASGVRFDTHAMMAAHRTLPFGTKVRVTNTSNHRSCIVEITDRGPFSHHRILDVSYAAAEKLGMTQSGTAHVEIEVLSDELMFKDLASESFDDAPVRKNQPVVDQIPSFTNRMMSQTMASAQAGVDDRR